MKLAEQGNTVYATMRNLAKAEELAQAAESASVDLYIKQLDVQNTESVQTCVNNIVQKEGRIDTLINNAGVGYAKTTEQSTEEEVNWVMDINFHGVVRCIKAVLPFMKKAQDGQIINITSVGGLVGQPFNEFYNATKFAVEGYTEALATYFTPAFGIKLTNIEPRGIVSEFANSIMEQLSATDELLENEYHPVLDKYLAEGTGDPQNGL